MLPTLTPEEHIQKLLSLPRPGEQDILAWYEHRLGAIAKTPRLMLLPLDDHLAHRGDGIFETVKYTANRLYHLDKHLERMQRSAAGIFLEPPCSWETIRSLIIEVAAAGGEDTGQIRALMGRGPGGFGIDPAECPVASLYIVAYRFEPKPESWFEAGLRGFRTTIPAKQGYLARIKNTNYLPNVLMIRETRAAGMDVPLCFDEDGYLAESAIANICLVDASGTLVIPEFTNSLPGTTILGALDLLNGEKPHVFRRVTEQDIFNASELLLLGTGPDCVAIVSYQGKTIGNGRQGPTAARLRALIQADILATGTPIK